MKRIAIAGNPNSGKTTIFNELSGKNERIGNWAGVTVEKKEANLRRRFNHTAEEIILVDLPGAYNMNAYTNDELEATKFLQNENIDAIINIVDASNLERSLYFTSQLIDTKIPVVVALNKSDITKKRNTKIDINKLGDLLNAKVFFTQATSRKGLHEVVDYTLDLLKVEKVHGKQRFKKRRDKKHNRTGSNKRCRCE